MDKKSIEINEYNFDCCDMLCCSHKTGKCLKKAINNLKKDLLDNPPFKWIDDLSKFLIKRLK